MRVHTRVILTRGRRSNKIRWPKYARQRNENAGDAARISHFRLVDGARVRCGREGTAEIFERKMGDKGAAAAAGSIHPKTYSTIRPITFSSSSVRKKGRGRARVNRKTRTRNTASEPAVADEPASQPAPAYAHDLTLTRPAT